MSLSATQIHVLEAMQHGWTLRSGLEGRSWLSRDGARPLELRTVRSDTLHLLFKKGLIEIESKGFPITRWCVTEKP